MSISASQVKALRDKTGISMGDCKKALVESNGDEEQAIEILKKKYAGKMDVRADKEAANGRIGAFANGTIGALVELRCETDFVAGNDDFVAAANDLAQLAAESNQSEPNVLLETKGADGRTGKDIITEAFGKLQENMVLARAAIIDKGCAVYVHHNGLFGSIVAADNPNEQKAKHICMHITSQQVLDGLNRDAIPTEAAAEAKAEMMEQAKGKPPEIAEKIVSGKMDKWYSERVLLEQPFVLDDKISVQEAAAQDGMTLTGYLKFELGAKS